MLEVDFFTTMRSDECNCLHLQFRILLNSRGPQFLQGVAQYKIKNWVGARDCGQEDFLMKNKDDAESLFTWTRGVFMEMVEKWCVGWWDILLAISKMASVPYAPGKRDRFFDERFPRLYQLLQVLLSSSRHRRFLATYIRRLRVCCWARQHVFCPLVVASNRSYSATNSFIFLFVYRNKTAE